MDGEWARESRREPQWGDERHACSRGGDKDGQSFMALRGIDVCTQSSVASTVSSPPGQGAVMMLLICEFYSLAGGGRAGALKRGKIGFTAHELPV